MASSDCIKSAKARPDPGREMRSGGGLLFIGAVIFVMTIGLEQRVGWPPPDAADIAEVLRHLWSSLRGLWAVQLIAGFLFGLSALLILRSPYLEARWIATPLVWSAVAIAAIVLAMMASALGLPTAGVVAFFAPALLGLALWRAGRMFAHGTTGLRDSGSEE